MIYNIQYIASLLGVFILFYWYLFYYYYLLCDSVL